MRWRRNVKGIRSGNCESMYGYTSMWYSFIRSNEEYNYKTITRSKFREICRDLACLIADTLVDESEAFHLPCGLGKIQCVKKRVRSGKERLVDPLATRQAGKIVRYDNYDGGEFNYKFKWSIAGGAYGEAHKYVKNYYFKPTATLRRRFGHNILNKVTDYIEI